MASKKQQKPIIVTFHLKAEGEPHERSKGRKKMIETVAKAGKISQGQVLRDLIDTL